MAKITARGARKVGPTFFTERTRPAGHGDVARVYYEAFRLRSDGDVQTRIVRTWPRDGSGEPTEHSSGFHSFGKLSLESVQQGTGPQDLRAYLVRKGYTIVKEQA